MVMHDCLNQPGSMERCLPTDEGMDFFEHPLLDSALCPNPSNRGGSEVGRQSTQIQRANVQPAVQSTQPAAASIQCFPMEIPEFGTDQHRTKSSDQHCRSGSEEHTSVSVEHMGGPPAALPEPAAPPSHEFDCMLPAIPFNPLRNVPVREASISSFPMKVEGFISMPPEAPITRYQPQSQGFSNFAAQEPQVVPPPPVPERSLGNSLKSKPHPMKRTWHNIPAMKWDSPFDPSSVELILHDSLDLDEDINQVFDPDVAARRDRALIKMHAVPETTVPTIRARAREIVQCVMRKNLAQLDKHVKNYGNVPPIMALVEMYLTVRGFQCMWVLDKNESIPVGKLLLMHEACCFLVSSRTGRAPFAVHTNEQTGTSTLLDPAALLHLIVDVASKRQAPFELPDNVFYTGKGGEQQNSA